MIKIIILEVIITICLSNMYKIVKNCIGEEACMLLATEMKTTRSLTNIALDNMTEEERENYQFGDSMIGDKCFAVYGLSAAESLLLLLQNKAEEIFKKELYPTYTYSRIYYNDAKMKKHTDRDSCEYSVSLCVEKDFYKTPYPLFVDGEPVELEPGDAIFYEGKIHEHWREEYKGFEHTQTFLHYVDKYGKYSDRKYDGRPFVGYGEISNYKLLGKHDLNEYL